MRQLVMILIAGITFTLNVKAETPYYQNDSLLRSDLQVVWPMIITVKIEYDLANAQLEFLKTKAEQDLFLKEFEEFIKKKYFKQVIALNYKQGKLLLLLIHRELGKTPYDLLKDYRNLSRANFWQRFAKLLGADLKEAYSPEAYPTLEREILNYSKLHLPFLN